MHKKFMAAFVAVIFAMSSAIVLPSQAAELKEENSTANTGTFFFDSGEWNADTVLFYIWDGDTSEYAINDGTWDENNHWGSRKWLTGAEVEGMPGVFESYEIDFTGREDHRIFVIFHDPESGSQTTEAYINPSVFGHTASLDGVIYENAVDSEKKCGGVSFDGGENVGVAKVITSSGKVQGDIIHPNQDRADTVAKFVLRYLSRIDPLTGEEIVTEESVANAISEFGTDKDSVWKAYQSYGDDPDYEYDYDEYYAKKVIRPTGSDDDNDDDDDNDYFELIFGDLDGDQRITSADSLMVLRASVELEYFTFVQEYAADVDEDGMITSGDALEILRYSVGLPSNTPIGHYQMQTYG